MNSIEDCKKEIIDCIKSSVNSSKYGTVFERLTDVFKTHFEKSSTNMVELRKKNTKNKGLIFEVFCKMYLLARGYHDVWLLSEVPQDILKYLNLERRDMGIDLIATIKIQNLVSESSLVEDKLENYFYIPVQAKYRKISKDQFNRKVHRVGWKDISTFLALCTRTGGPKGWLKHMIITNADNVTWKGKKSKKDFTYAKKTFEKCSNIFWLKMIDQDKGRKLIEEIDTEEDLDINEDDDFVKIDSDSDTDEKKIINSLIRTKESKVSLAKMRSSLKESEIRLEKEYPNNEEKKMDVKQLRMKWLNNLTKT